MIIKDEDLIGAKIYDDKGNAAGIITGINGASFNIEATESFKEKLKENTQVAFSLRAIPRNNNKGE